MMDTTAEEMRIAEHGGWAKQLAGRMSRKSWEQLSPAARNVLARIGRE